LRPIATFAALLATFAAPVLLAAPQAQARGADGHFEERSSSHFLLLQDVAIDRSGGFYGSRRFEREVLAELERAYEKLDALLGLRPERRIQVVVYDPARFDAQFAGLFRFPAAGFYGGVICIRGDTRLTAGLARVLHHELVHAALHDAAPSLVLPAWVNEGGAEWFEMRAALGKRGISARERGALAGRGALQPLAALSTPSFGHLGPRAASLAYLQSYALVDFLARRGGERKLARFYDQLLRSRNLDRALRRVYRLDAASLEADFFAELR